jgi:adenylate cyclase
MSYRWKVFLLALVSSLSVAGSTALVGFYDSRAAATRQVVSKVNLAAEVGAALIDPELVTHVQRRGDERAPEFTEIRSLLRKALETGFDSDSLLKLFDLCTVLPSPDQPNGAVYGVDAERRYAYEQLPGQPYPAPFVNWTTMDPMALVATEANVATFPDASRGLAAHALITDRSGKRVGALEVDAPIEMLSRAQKRALAGAVRALSLGSASALLFALIISLWSGRTVGALTAVLEGYVPDNVRQAALSGKPFAPASQRRLVTVLFADIRGFTGTAEVLSPETAVAILNDFYDAMVQVVQSNGGFINKFLGDGLMALFGAPQDDAYQHEHAVRAALEMDAEAARLSEKWKPTTGRELKLGMGIHSGSAVVGSVGSAKHLEYTAIGDVVNVASRLQAACKDHGVSILLSAQTYQEARPSFTFEKKGEIEIRGRAESMTVYSVESLSGTGAPH